MEGLERWMFSSSSITTMLTIVVVAIAVLPHTSYGHATEDDFLRLYDNLTSNYNRHMRPVRNQSAPVYISFDLTLLSILEIKDTESQVDLISLIQTSWHDPNLVWDPSDYGGISRLSLSESTIWAPYLALHPSQQGSSPGPLWDIPTSSSVQSNGQVLFVIAGQISMFCDLDMTFFPYDYQKCELSIKIVEGVATEVAFGTHAAQLSSTFIQNKEWIVKAISSEVQYFGYPPASLISISFFFQRRPAFNSLNIIVPAIINSILCMLTFFVPIESGERLSYTLTTLLSLAVYITYIGGLIPRSSNPIPILFEYMVFLFTISSVCVILTLLVIKLRWTRVEVSPLDNHKYICILGFQFFLTKRPRLNQIDAISWLRSNTEQVCDKNTVKVSMGRSSSKDNWGNKNEIITDFILTDRTLKENSTNKNKAIQIVSEKNVQIEPNASQFPFPFSGEQTSTDGEKADKEDPELLSLCNKLDIGSFCLTFLTFIIMTTYTFVRFYQQEEPKP